MKCVNHQEKEVSGACVHCGKFFCEECITEIKGKNYCKKCVSEVFEEKDKRIDNLENKAFSNPTVFMNAGGGGASSSSSAASSSSGSSGHKGPYPRNSIVIHILLLLFTAGIGNIIYYLYIKDQQRKWNCM